MKKLYALNINAFLQIFHGPSLYLNEEVIERSLTKNDNEICVDFKDFINSQMVNKIVNVPYEAFIKTYCFVNDREYSLYNSMNDVIAENIIQLYDTFLLQFSVIGMYLALKFNAKLYLRIDKKLFDLVLSHIGLDYSMVKEIFIYSDAYDLDCSDLDYYRKLLSSYNIKLPPKSNDVDLEHLNLLNKCYKSVGGKDYWK